MADVRFVKQSFKVIDAPDDAVRLIADAARTCYRSEAKSEDADERLVRNLVKSGHHAMLEFANVTVRVTCDRGISHELVRHRLFSFAQESQRYVDGEKNGLEFILPDLGDDRVWHNLRFMPAELKEEQARRYIELSCKAAAHSYELLRSYGAPPEVARYVLPNATATRIVIRGNLREWMHFFTLRCDTHAHPVMRRLALDMLAEFRRLIPVVFDDLEFEGV